MLNDTLRVLEEAIRDRKHITFHYSDGAREVEPFLVGRLKTTRNLVLSAWHISGFTESHSKPEWRVYAVAKIRHLSILNREFDGLRPKFNPKDSRMREILFAVDPDDRSNPEDR